MRLVNVAAAAAAVVVGFTGSLTAAHALVPDPLPLPLPVLPVEDDEADTMLTVNFRADADAAPIVRTLGCDPTSGDHPRATKACAALAKAAAAGEDPFAEPEPDRLCTEIYGGPQTATVTGTWRGSVVDAGFARTDGCEIARWDAIAPVLNVAPPRS